MEWLIAELRSAGIVILRLVGVVIGAVVLYWVALLIEQKTRTPRIEPSPTEVCDLDGLTCTVTKAYYTHSIEAVKAKEGASYLVVCLNVWDRRTAARPPARFRLVDSKGEGYDMTGFETVLANNDFYRHFDILEEPPSLSPLLHSRLSEKSLKSISLVFEVSKESLDRTWTLLIRDRDDKRSIGAIKVGSISVATEDHN